ncbi:hypothetical protein [Mameliella alba]|uniref:hypothetical protein n=1 Tax=Mameliella alba TaxID=561184 RepID=UPI000B52CB2E|nr:hypothetical protein [Mameliella alba]MBY6122524.1 hypothetical protein [Mameliella alba]OWV39334.1 hypothetical protein CDZ95_26390 [Mameliella alba]OWV52729.1 hypothetical protein CDZ97_25820 [Mameliella alba]
MPRPLLIASPLILLALAACEPVPGGGAPSGPTSAAPEAVAAIAAPYQDLSRVRWRSEDGCYWYTHDGPVETTELPVRTSAGNPICTRPRP